MCLLNANLKIEAQSNLCDDIPYNVSVYQNFGIIQSAPPISTTTIKVYFMVYRDNDGSNGVSNQRLQDIMDRLNTNFQAVGFAFVWRLCETIYTNDTDLNNSFDACLFNEIHTDGLNIHVRGDSKPHRARANSIPGTVVFVGGTHSIDQNNTFSGDTPSATNSIVHEVGHCLGLFHTHHGSCKSAVPTILCSSDINTMDSPNGDMVDDTPLDSKLEDKMIIGACTWNGVKCDNDMNIPITNPLTNNFMSYTRPTCMTSFTAGQITRMQALCPSNIKYNGPTGVPTLSGEEVSNQCPVRTFDLNTLVNSLLPCGAEVRWSTDSGPLNSSSPIVSNLVAQTGFYYAYYYYADENSYGPASIPVFYFKTKCCGDLEDLIITSNMEIILNQDMGNIKVKSGYTLTIKSTLQFAEDKGIEVEYGAKLIIDGGTLTKCPLVDSWKGIKAQGDLSYILGFGQPTTEVIVKNAGNIEYAYIAINAVGQITFFTTTDIGGAKITINGNSIISHCHIGVKLGPIYGLNDLSSIDHATFSNNDKAILLSGNNGLKVSNSVFDHNAMDIEGCTSSVLADHNVFNGGVLMDAEFPTFEGSTFINSEFFDAVTIGAMSNATDFFIQNNQFFSTGIIITGELDFDIRSNDFHESPEGTWISESGDNIQNFVTANNFYDNDYGNSASGLNDTEYEKNCFNGTDSWDIEVTESSSIHETQGITDDAAGNCFSKKIGTGSTSDHFDYYVLQNTIPQSCKKPGAAGNFTEKSSSVEQAVDCGTGVNIYGFLLPRYRDCMITNAADLKPMITLLRAEIIALENNTTLSPWIRRWLIAKYKRCLDKVIKQKSKDDRDQKGRDSTVVFLSSQPEFRYQAMAYGLIMESNNHLGARTLLNTLPYIEVGEQDFIAVQNIYLDYLADRSAYVLSNANKSIIYNAGLRQHPLAGFARSVHYTMTGQKVPITLTHLNGNTLTRSKKDPTLIQTIKIYPNPTEFHSFIIGLQDFDENTKYQCIVLDINGKTIIQNDVSKNNQLIDLPNINSGIYIVRITNGDRTIYVGKLVVK